MLVPRDREILRFVEDFGGITINQCASMFFKETKRPYDLARKRLSKIADMTEMKFYANKLTGERVYCFDRKLSPHFIYIMNFFAKLINSGCKVLDYKLEPKWMGGEYRSDAFFKIEYCGVKRIVCLEVDVTHTTDMKKYEKIFDNGEIQSVYGTFPLIVIVGDIIREYQGEDFSVVYLDYKLNNFIEKVLVV